MVARLFAITMWVVLPAVAQAAEKGGVPVEIIPETAIRSPAIDLLAPRQISYTPDAILVARGDCAGDSDISFHEYSTTTLEMRRQFQIKHCGRFNGNSVTAMTATGSEIWIVFGQEPEVNGYTEPTDSDSRPNLLVAHRDRSLHA